MFIWLHIRPQLISTSSSPDCLPACTTEFSERSLYNCWLTLLPFLNPSLRSPASRLLPPLEPRDSSLRCRVLACVLISNSMKLFSESRQSIIMIHDAQLISCVITGKKRMSYPSELKGLKDNNTDYLIYIWEMCTFSTSEPYNRRVRGWYVSTAKDGKRKKQIIIIAIG